jgi:predicted lipoprotein with Yx(FWY)xxD motif
MKRVPLLSLVVALLVSSLALVLTVSAGKAAVSSPAIVKVAFDKKLKKSILVDARGFTLYLFALDTHGKPTCTDDPSYHCIKAWPALKTTSAPHAGAGVRQSLLGVAKRTDGGVQVTYNHHPLYYFHGGADYGAGDKTPGDIHGQGFAGIWFVVAPDGTPIRF